MGDLTNDDRQRSFHTTRWSLIAAAADPAADNARAALEELCRAYWPPLYAFVRRRGVPAAEAEDRVQEFFAFVLERDVLARTDRQLGKFRSFLLASLKNFLHNQRDYEQALKRGGGRKRLPLDFGEAERQYRQTSSGGGTPDEEFEREWARTLLAHVRDALHREYAQAGKVLQFQCLWPLVAGHPERRPYADVAAELGLTEVAVKVAVHRLRARFGDLLRREIAETVASPEDVQEELDALFRAVKG